MTTEEFIEKWNVAYESLEQKAEFAAEMRRDLKSIGKHREKIAASESWDVAILKTTHISSDNAWIELFDKEKEEYLKKYDQ